MDKDLYMNYSVRSIEVAGKTLKLHAVQRRGRKNTSMTLDADGSITVVSPTTLHTHELTLFVTKHTKWILKALSKLYRHKKRIRESTQLNYSKGDYLERKPEAEALLYQRVEKYKNLSARAPLAVRVKYMRSRWGSCSRKGVLSFSFALMYLPDHLVDYVVVHELCHLREFNHSPKFWSLVRIAVPEYKKCRKELRKYRLAE